MNIEKLPVHKRYVEPTQQKKEELYKLYELIFDSTFTLSKKRSVITAVLGYETWSWRVVGITEEAVKAIARNNFNKPSRKLCRYKQSSKALMQMQNQIFKQKMVFNEWWDWVWENDQTILMTNEEHRLIHLNQPSKTYLIEPKLSLFVDAEVAGWHQTQAREGAFLRKLCEEHKIEY